MNYKKELENFTTAIQLKIPTETSVRGVNTKTYALDDTFNCSWKSKGGTEKVVNGVIVIEDTVEIVCWYNPKITKGCQIINLSSSKIYEVIGEPENIDNSNRIMKFKIVNVSGGA